MRAGKLVLLVVPWLVHCGGSDSSTGFGSGAKDGGAGGAKTALDASGASRNGDDGAMSGDGGAAGRTAQDGGHTEADASLDGPLVPSDATPSDAGGDVRVVLPGDAAPGDAVAPPPVDTATPGTIYCAGVQCTIAGLPTTECCVGAVPFPTTCLPSFPGCVNGGVLAIACDDAADCSNGDVCCGNFTGVGAGAHCAKTCASPAFQVCRTHSECHDGKKCAPIPQSPNYGQCQ